MMEIVDILLENDPFSKWLGIEVLEAKEGYCLLRCQISQECLNGFKVAHGGIIFSIADTAMAFASATFGKMCVTANSSISFLRPVIEGDILTAKAISRNRTSKLTVIDVEINNQSGALCAIVKGTMFIKDIDLKEYLKGV